MKKKILTGREATEALKEQATKVDQQGLSWSLDPSIPGEAAFFRVTVEGEGTPMTVQLLADGTWILAR